MRERQRGWGYKRFVVRRSAYILVFAGYTAAFYDAASRAGSLETCGFKQTFWSLLGLRPKVARARSAEYSRRRERSERRRWRIQRGERVAAVKISSARRQAAQKFRAPQQCSFSNINRAAGPYGVRLSSCAGKCGRGAGRKKRDQDRTRCAIGVGGGESRRCHSAGTK